jgi:TolA-binding protein
VPGDQRDNPVFSRVVHATVGQTVEIPFRGSGWVYLGELENQRGMNYLSRRTDSEGQSFLFRADEAGTFDLKFYKQDFIQDYILNDYVKIIVEPPSIPALGGPAGTSLGGNNRIIAEPRWPEPVVAAPDAATAPGTAPETVPGAATVSAPETVPGAVSSETVPAPGTTPENLLSLARDAYGGGRLEEALSYLGHFEAAYPAGSDEAYWLYGQIYETTGTTLDIRSALDYYRRLVRDYPQSTRYEDARRRISYIERYYMMR